MSPLRASSPLNLASLCLLFALTTFTLLSCKTTSSIKYRPLNEQAHKDLGAHERSCVHVIDQDRWTPGLLTQHTCSPWTSRSDLDIINDEWIFFPNVLLGVSSRTQQGCTTCRLDVKRLGSPRGDEPRGTPSQWALKLLSAKEEELARYEGTLKGGMFEGAGTLTLYRTEACSGYCKDFFVANAQLVDRITVTGSWAKGVLSDEAPFTTRYVVSARQESYAGDAIYDPARGVTPQGEGTLTRQDVVVYRGEWRGGLWQGRGEELREDGTRYKGEFQAGKWEGRGELILPGGDRYEGEFLEGMRHGQGVNLLADGTRYEGEFVRDVAQGKGVLIEPGGDRYEGEFVRGVRHGRGAQQVAHSAERYDGEWREGVRHGQGRWTNREGITFEGRWTAAELEETQVKIIWPEGQPYVTYEGALQELQPHGPGVMIWTDGVVYRGAFKNGRLSGQGLLSWPDGRAHVGRWADGGPEGCGLHRDIEGELFVGTWLAGELTAASCDTPPEPWSREEIDSFGPTELERNSIARTLAAQRQSKKARDAAAARLALIAPSYTPSASPPSSGGALRKVRIAFAHHNRVMQRMMHPSCVTEQALSLTANDAPISGQRGGIVDAEIVVWLPAGETIKVCARQDSPCGEGQGCAPIDVPAEEMPAPLRTRILLERLDAAREE